ncbi:hypothetical protein [Halalkalicoccus tibetensis]|uniref:N-acetylglutamate synthase n=1 Tax=Halalkalicoccus tibetensis TaxID=175632 RepID=A0ABD5UZZ0_9EURY
MATDGIDMDGRVLRATSNDADGTVSDATTFRFEQDGDLIQARYEGGEIRQGFLVGLSDGEGLDFRYTHLTVEGETATGHSIDEIERLPDGRVRLHEEWSWDSKEGAGTSVLEEVDEETRA